MTLENFIEEIDPVGYLDRVINDSDVRSLLNLLIQEKPIKVLQLPGYPEDLPKDLDPLEYYLETLPPRYIVWENISIYEAGGKERGEIKTDSDLTILDKKKNRVYIFMAKNQFRQTRDVKGRNGTQLKTVERILKKYHNIRPYLFSSHHNPGTGIFILRRHYIRSSNVKQVWPRLEGDIIRELKSLAAA